jgi:glycosidase
MYQQLIAYRRQTPALSVGTYRSVDGAPDDSFVYVREFEGQRVAVALNFSEKDQTLSLPELGGGEIVISTHLDREGPANMASFVLRGYEGCVVALAG